MAGILPDTGVIAANTVNATTTALVNASCQKLFYALRCNVRIEPSAMNALISELLNLMTSLGHTYDCNSLENLANAMDVLQFRCLSELQAAGTPPLNGLPRVYMDDVSSNKSLRVWDCETAEYVPLWIDCCSKHFAQATDPAIVVANEVSVGDTFYDTTIDTTFLRVNDGSRDIWLDISN